MFDHVLVAIDFSPAWPLLRQRLEQLGRAGTRRATLVYVLSSRYPETPEMTHQDAYRQRLREEAEQLSSTGLMLETELRTGEPGRELVDAAIQTKADLLLLGRCGHGKASQFLIGSTAIDALRLTRCPIWLEPLDSDKHSTSGTILLATDGSTSARGAERMFERLAPKFAHRAILTVCEDPRETSREQREAASHLSKLAGGIQGAQYRVQSGDPDHVIATVAEELAADLIVVGKRGRSGIAELLTGSTAEAVCARAGRPVLLVPV